MPRNCDCSVHKGKAPFPQGLTHGPEKPCPFAKDDLPIGPFASCCSFCGKVAASALDTLGETRLASRMFEDMNCGEAAAFAAELRKAAARIESAPEHAAKPDVPTGTVRVDLGARELVRETFSFEDAIDTIRQAAGWYDKTAALGAGVWAWS